MESSFLGVIPLNTSEAKFLCMNLAKLVAVGIEYTAYVFDTHSGENIIKVSHYPHKIITGNWSSQDLVLATSDSSGDILLTDLQSDLSSIISLGSPIHSLDFHVSSSYLFAASSEKILILCTKTKSKINEVLVAGFKVVTDLFCPQKIVIIAKDEVALIRNFIKDLQVHRGKIENIVDAITHPSYINSLYVLTSSQLVEYDTVRNK